MEILVAVLALFLMKWPARLRLNIGPRLAVSSKIGLPNYSAGDERRKSNLVLTKLIQCTIVQAHKGRKFKWYNSDTGKSEPLVVKPVINRRNKQVLASVLNEYSFYEIAYHLSELHIVGLCRRELVNHVVTFRPYL